MEESARFKLNDHLFITDNALSALPMQARHSHRGKIKTIALQVPKYERERAKLAHKKTEFVSDVALSIR